MNIYRSDGTYMMCTDPHSVLVATFSAIARRRQYGLLRIKSLNHTVMVLVRCSVTYVV